MHALAYLHDMVVVRLVCPFLFLLQIDNVALLKREIFRHLVILLQLPYAEARVLGNLLEAVALLGVDIEKSVCLVDGVSHPLDHLPGLFLVMRRSPHGFPRVVAIKLVVFYDFDEFVCIGTVGGVAAFLKPACPTFIVGNLQAKQRLVARAFQKLGMVLIRFLHPFVFPETFSPQVVVMIYPSAAPVGVAFDAEVVVRTASKVALPCAALEQALRKSDAGRYTVFLLLRNRKRAVCLNIILV